MHDDQPFDWAKLEEEMGPVEIPGLIVPSGRLPQTYQHEGSFVEGIGSAIKMLLLMVAMVWLIFRQPVWEMPVMYVTGLLGGYLAGRVR